MFYHIIATPYIASIRSSGHALVGHCTARLYCPLFVSVCQGQQKSYTDDEIEDRPVAVYQRSAAMTSAKFWR